MTDIIAHRGYRLVAPENTIPAFEAALAYDIDMLETDVHRTKDGQLVIIHDEQVDRTTNGMGLVSELTLDQIKSLEAGQYKQPKMNNITIPTLEELLVFLLAKKFNKTLLLEIKTDHIPYPGIEKEILDLVNQFNVNFEIIYQSFNMNSLRIVRKLEPSAKIAALVFWPSPKVIWLKVIGVVDFVHPDIRMLKKKPQLFWHMGFPIRPWTADKENDIRAVFKSNLSGVITNQVALASQIRKEVQNNE
ncbi:glycerophosphoryl diester phosphodiesterase [Leuconostoc litchii]|uniref:Glycerophosphodiester phosphodiesterase n=1 Tax=Leuconostoc litchii TaxID=1981069 RepID=A0A652NE29_9LACO|nr:glycerophosphodiester phosphodiesterase family protein [Leuconostoc litchii]TYC46027.1 glycerophosphodiester phosphodiesterase [Leuconostoc litchii]GMA70262.1 glycerophosphoryl diester phosphodiesterase [Leuconostoc litchii]